MKTIIFSQLYITQKGEYVFQEGEYIGLREYYNHRINLYSLFDFFVEVWYFPAENKIEKIEVMESEKTLDLYIDKMIELDKKPKPSHHENNKIFSNSFVLYFIFPGL